MVSANPSNSHYVHFIIEDEKKIVRGHLIGVQHWVDPKDKLLNSQIRKAMKASSRILLEQPPGSDLLPKEADSYKFVSQKVISELKISVSTDPSPVDLTIKEKISHLEEEVAV